MLAVDTNVLVYAHRREANEHAVASRELRALAGGADAWAIPWPCVYEFFSVVTNPRIWRDAASTGRQAAAQVQAWCASPSLVLIGESDAFLTVLAPLLDRPRVRGPVIHDARVAAICLAHGVDALLTRDRDFSLFPELPTRDPFA
ncbi:MAG: PIN domain-containing protein [Myxococcales bacterium]|nr:PIN domain-containing protein [Myxococcales bacterium]